MSDTESAAAHLNEMTLSPEVGNDAWCLMRLHRVQGYNAIPLRLGVLAGRGGQGRAQGREKSPEGEGEGRKGGEGAIQLLM